jgi:hypothetical protein
MIAPGANALSLMPHPAHSDVTAWRRTQRLTAIFEAAYAMAGAAPRNGLTARTARSASPANTARTARRGTTGMVVVELLDTATTLALPVTASADRHATKDSTTPK